MDDSLTIIEPGHFDSEGRYHETPPDTRDAIIKALGGEGRIRLIEPVSVVSLSAQPQEIPVRFPLKEGASASVDWSIEDEHGNIERQSIDNLRVEDYETIGGIRYVKASIPNRTDRGLGYYTVKVDFVTPEGAFSGEMRLIVTPDRCYVPEGRSWGITLSLYSLRSEHNWGIGDFGDLKEIIIRIMEHGGGFVGINPLHAIPNRMPFGISPYYPISRLYRNFIYLDMQGALTDLGVNVAVPRAVNKLRDGEFIDYEKVAGIKLKALKKAIKTPDYKRPEFLLYVEKEGPDLRRFAAFLALSEHFKSSKWQDWPDEYRDPDGPAVNKFVSRYRSKIRFYMFVQWLIDRQLGGISSLSGEMPIGLYGDLAVGSSGDGSNAWANRDVLAQGMSAGAPPDAFNPNGQNWGFPPINPRKLRETGYELFIKTIRKNLEHMGALRIDHALGLFRLFWIPDGKTPKDGAYVRYPSEDLLRIIALESVRARAVIIAEDLGIVPDEFKTRLMQFGMLSYRLFYFERNWNDGTFLPPCRYPELALAAVTTHDLPTLRGFWAGRDIEVKAALGIYRSDERFNKEKEERENDKKRIMDALYNTGLVESSDMAEMTPGLLNAIHKYLAMTPCKLVSVCLDDLLGKIEQQNMPGTIDEHPNWRRKANLTVDELFTRPEVEALARIMRDEVGR